ncbi:MAG: hypothetical protein NTW19_12170 [Planctomycetota bacterium]|nr:hypothetical protein [Planctomycetota bacterium]
MPTALPLSRALALLAILLSLAAPALAQNLVTNGDFESAGASTDEPRGWHTHITSFIPIPEYRDPEHKQGRTGVYHFKCGCGHDWGTVRPWALLVCPQCKHAVTGLEDSGDWYQKNDECVTVGGPGSKSGHALIYRLPEAVGNNQGVRALSDPIRVKRGEGFDISFDTKASGAHCRVFVEGFRLENDDKAAQAWVKTLPPESNPLKQTTRLKRVFRQSVNANTPGEWTTFREQFVSEGRYAFDVLIVNLYAYLPGEAGYDNVVLRRLTPAEMSKYRQDNPPSEDERLR